MLLLLPELLLKKMADIKVRVGSQNAIKVVSTTEAKARLSGLLDVDVTGATDGMVLFYNQSNSRWESGIIDGGTY